MEETVSAIAEALTQEPALTMEPIEEEIMDMMNGIDTVIQESTFINGVQRETMPTSPVQEALDMGGGATQEPPPTHLVLENLERMSPEVDTSPQEPVSTTRQELTQEGGSGQSRIVANEGKELEVSSMASID